MRVMLRPIGHEILRELIDSGDLDPAVLDNSLTFEVEPSVLEWSAFRAMSQAALNVYETLRKEGTQKAVVDDMQTRMELYDYLGYHDYEQKLDSLFAEGKNK